MNTLVSFVAKKEAEHKARPEKLQGRKRPKRATTPKRHNKHTSQLRNKQMFFCRCDMIFRIAPIVCLIWMHNLFFLPAKQI